MALIEAEGVSRHNSCDFDTYLISTDDGYGLRIATMTHDGDLRRYIAHEVNTISKTATPTEWFNDLSELCQRYESLSKEIRFVFSDTSCNA